MRVRVPDLEGHYMRTESRVPRTLIITSDTLLGPQLTFRNEDVEKKVRISNNFQSSLFLMQISLRRLFGKLWPYLEQFKWVLFFFFPLELSLRLNLV